MAQQTSEKEPQVDSGTSTATKSLPVAAKPRQLPPWKVLLHNDDVNDMGYVIDTITMLTTLNRADAAQRMLEAHLKGLTLLLTTHKERAELYKDQFASRKLIVTIEAGE